MRADEMKNCVISRPQGFSLVELMVGMVLGLFLVLGVAQIFFANKGAFHSQEGLAKIQEGGRFAMQRISNAVRMAGFFGCAGAPKVGEFRYSHVLVVPPYPDGFDAITANTAIEGQNNVSVGTIIDGRTLVEDSDILTLRGSGLAGISYTGVQVNPEDDITINNPNYPIVEGDYVVISDCGNITMIRATKDTDMTTVKHAMTSDGSNYNISDSLKATFKQDAIVTNAFVNTFFVADSGRTNFQGNQVMSLYLRDMGGTVYELIEGVSDFQVLYGVDTDDDDEQEQYLDAKQITDSTTIDWGDVISVRVSLLVDSVDDALGEPTNYTFMGNLVTPASTDKRLRKEFTGLYTLRNRALGDMK